MKLIITSLIAIAGISQAFDWPIAPVNQTHKIDGSYGGSNIPWDDASPINLLGNFHSGIDIFLTALTPPGDEEEVYAVEAGYITDIIEGIGPEEENRIIICDTPYSSDEGWAYLHVKNTHGYQKYEHIEDITVSIANVYQGGSGNPHLHFQRSGPTWTDPSGLCNPLDFLDPDLLGEECWNFMPQPASPEHPWCYFLVDMTTEEWESWEDSADIFDDTLAANDLHGSVDIIQGFWLRTNGDIGAQPGLPEDWAVPHRIKWECVQVGASSTDQSVFTRYLASFDGIVGAIADWEKYRQFYFRYHYRELYTTEYGTLNCLSNSGDALPDPGWEGFGVSNIEENCWQTDIDHLFSEVTCNPVLAAFPDGPYRIDVISYAYDTTETNSDLLDIELHNFDPVAQEVIITGNTDEVVWHAKWVANDLVPELMILTNKSVAPDQTLDATVIFTEPMNTSSGTYNVTAGKAPDNPIIINPLFDSSTTLV